MKKSNMKTNTVLLFSVFILALCCIGFILGIGPEKVSAYFSAVYFSDDFKAEKPFSDYNFSRLTNIEKQAYISIFENISEHPKYIKIPNLTKEQFNNVYFAVKNDNPDILCFSDSCNMISFLSATFLELNYIYTADECSRLHELLQKKSDEIAAGVPEYFGVYETELYLHDYIINSCVYTQSENSSNAYGCLVENKAVCSGYSRAAMILLKKCGIESILVGGTGISQTQGEVSHMWNVVWIEEQPYHLDVTWDDTGEDSSESHLYFNMTDDKISLDHKDYVLDFTCNAEDFNYFYHEGLKFEAYTKDSLNRIENKIIKNIKNGLNYLEFTFDTDTEYKKAYNALIENKSGSDMYKILTRVGNEISGSVDISHVVFANDDNNKYIKLMFDWN